ncbi:hypothetical protein ACN08Y_10155 [Rothia sp. P5764]|uniref:hypothetical protein n=1 Tax=Rothia sp. P5764 TaxID=3402654 RepID=UPI003AC92781
MNSLQLADPQNLLIVAESGFYAEDPEHDEPTSWVYHLDAFALSPKDGEIVAKIRSVELDGTPGLDRPRPFYLTREEVENRKLEDGREERDLGDILPQWRPILIEAVLNEAEHGLTELMKSS